MAVLAAGGALQCSLLVWFVTDPLWCAPHFGGMCRGPPLRQPHQPNVAPCLWPVGCCSAVQGLRAPFLEIKGEVWEILKDNGFLYDRWGKALGTVLECAAPAMAAQACVLATTWQAPSLHRRSCYRPAPSLQHAD